MDISVIIPVYNSKSSLPIILDQIRTFFNNASRKIDYEVIFVNDCSDQETYAVLERLKCASDSNPPLVIHLAKNVGQQMAICHGLKQARGTYALTMDDDLQHDIADFDALYQKAELGSDLVFGVYAQHGEDMTRSLGSKWIGLFFKYRYKKLNGCRVSSYRLIHHTVYNKIDASNQAFVYLSAELIPHAKKIANVTIQRLERPFGKSGYTLVKCVKIALKLVINYGFIASHLSIKGEATSEKIVNRRCG